MKQIKSETIIYERPQIEVVSVNAECGFAHSGWGDGTMSPRDGDNFWELG